MANNCLVTKLKSVVDNDNLKELGKLNFKIGASSSPSFEPYYYLAVMNSVACEMKSPDSYFCNPSGNNIGNSIQVAANTYAEARFPLTGGKYSITNPYTLKGFYLIDYWSTFDITDLKYIFSLQEVVCKGENIYGALEDLLYNKSLTSVELEGPISGNVSSLANQTGLTSLTLSGTSFTGNLSSISGLTALTQLILGCTNVSGIFTDLGSMTSLTTIHFATGSGLVNISGSVEDFVNAQRQAGRTTATDVVVGYIAATNITYRGDSLFGNPASLNSKLSWTADSITLTIEGVVI